MSSGFEPPTRRKQFGDTASAPSPSSVPAFAVPHQSPAKPQPAPPPPPPQKSSGGFFSAFRKSTSPQTSPQREIKAPNYGKYAQPNEFRSAADAQQSDRNTHPSSRNPDAPFPPRRISTKDLNVLSSNAGNLSSNNTSSSHSDAPLVDPYSMPREDLPDPPAANNSTSSPHALQTPSAPSSAGVSSATPQKPRHASTPSSSTLASNATDATATPSSGSNGRASASTRSLHPELRSLLSLNAGHAQKVYFSGPLQQCNERGTDGARMSKGGDWREVWAQLGGTSLSIWDMKEIEEANQQGRQAPPKYLNVTDAFLRLSGPARIPGNANGSDITYRHVFTLNTAGLNLFSFACQDQETLISWVAAIRLAVWEKARLEEIYTGHLLRMSLSDPSTGKWKEPRSTLVRGRMAGWVKVRVAGQTEWKRVWAVVSAAAGDSADDHADAEFGARPTSPTQTKLTKRNRLSSMFTSVGGHGKDYSSAGTTDPGALVGPANLSLYAGQKPKERKTPVLMMTDVSLAFAVYPDRVELINMSTLIKVEGKLGNQEYAGGLQGREGWLFIMPELEPEKIPPMEMLKWVVAIHDAFAIHGRPQGYTWDPFNPSSAMFAYPVGDQKSELFLSRDEVEGVDPRYDRMSVIREAFMGILSQKMAQKIPRGAGAPRTASPPAPIPKANTPPQMRLGPLDFESREIPEPPAETQVSSSLPQIGAQTHPDPPAKIEAASRELLADDRFRLGMPRVSSPTEFTFASVGKGLEDSPTDAVKNDSPRERRMSDESYYKVAHPSEPSSIFNERTESPQERNHSLSATPILASARSNDSLNSARRSVVMPSSPLSANPSVGGQQQLFAKSSDTGSLQPSSTDLSPPVYGLSHANAPISSLHHRTSTIETLTPTERRSPEVFVAQSPRSLVGVQLRDPGSTPPPGARASPGASNRPGNAPRRSSLGPGADDKPTIRPSSSYQSLTAAGANRVIPESSPTASPRRSPVNVTNSVVGGAHARALPLPHAVQPDDYSSIVSPSGGMSIVERLRQQIAEEEGYTGEAGAQYIAQRLRDGSTVGHSIEEDEDSEEATAEQHVVAKPQHAYPSSSAGPPPSSFNAAAVSPDGLTRRPSGARPQPGRMNSNSAPTQSSHSASDHGLSVDALAALTFAEGSPSDNDASSSNSLQTSGMPPINQGPLPSSFSNSKAAERKAKLQEQEAAYHAAAHKPGRSKAPPSGKSRPSKGWESSDEEEEEDDDDDDEEEEDDDSDGEPNRGHNATPGGAPGASTIRSQPPTLYAPQPQTPAQISTSDSAGEYGVSPLSQLQSSPGYGAEPGRRRDLPSIPRPGSATNVQQANRSRSRTPYNDQQQDPSDYPPPPRLRSGERIGVGAGSSPRQQPQQLRPNPQMPRQSQNMWNSPLNDKANGMGPNAGGARGGADENNQSSTMTKAFAPTGLLQAGLHDRNERSARRQEETARGSGGAFVHVPSKPPPPQSGLVGAITAHERERKREGGMGAALTERERERRMAEERQRKIDELQRQQLELAQQGMTMPGSHMSMAGFDMSGMSAVGGFTPQQQQQQQQQMMMMGGMNPMLLNPMMMGGGGGHMSMMGMPPMFGGMSQQQQQQQQMLLAAQQAAAHAYQNAMMAFSQAGSVAGSEIGGPTAGGAGDTGTVIGGQGGHQQQPHLQGGMNPAAMSMYGGGGLTPQMTGQQSMYGMPMNMGMGMGMGMNMPMNYGMGPMGMGMPMGNFSSPGGSGGFGSPLASGNFGGGSGGPSPMSSPENNHLGGAPSPGRASMFGGGMTMGSPSGVGLAGGVAAPEQGSPSMNPGANDEHHQQPPSS